MAEIHLVLEQFYLHLENLCSNAFYDQLTSYDKCKKLLPAFLLRMRLVLVLKQQLVHRNKVCIQPLKKIIIQIYSRVTLAGG